MAVVLAANHAWTFLLIWTAGAATSAATRRGSGNSAWIGALFPFDALFLAATLAFAMLDRARGRAAPWRGREIGIGS
jgi:hypothetical protein